MLYAVGWLGLPHQPSGLFLFGITLVTDSLQGIQVCTSTDCLRMAPDTAIVKAAVQGAHCDWGQWSILGAVGRVHRPV